MPSARAGLAGRGQGRPGSGAGLIGSLDISLSPRAAPGTEGINVPKPVVSADYRSAGSLEASDAGGTPAQAGVPRRRSDLRSHEAYARLREVKRILGDAGPETQSPFFFFRPPSGKPIAARAKGLEGFLYSKLEFERDNGEVNTLGQLDDYFGYLDNLLKPVSWTADLRRDLTALRQGGIAPLRKNRALNARLTRAVADFRTELEGLTEAAWGREASIYLIFARGYNRLKDGRNFFDSLDDEELDRIRHETGADTVWVMDMFDIGDVNRWGNAGGSPYALKRYRVKPELGGDAAYKAFSERAARKGLKLRNVADYVVNHTSIDSDMVRDLPEGLLHIVPPQPNEGEDLGAYKNRILEGVPRDHNGSPVYALVESKNYPEGEKRVRKFILIHHPMQGGGFPFLYVDMAQIDYSRPEARAYRIQEIAQAYKELGLNGLRRDLAYMVLNDKFFDLWLGNLTWERDRVGEGWFKDAVRSELNRLKKQRGLMAGREYLDEMTEALYAADPDVFIFDEAYERFEDLSRAGANAYYDKMGLYDALRGRFADHVRAALREAAFRLWQQGGAGLLHFIGTHDAGEGNPIETFGPVYRAAAALTLMLRPILFYNGTELGTDREHLLISDELDQSEDHRSSMKKMIPFDVKALINWSNRDRGRAEFLHSVLEAGGRNQDIFRDGAMEILRPTGGTPIVAYSAGKINEDGSKKAIIVAGNLSENESAAVFKFDKPVLAGGGAFVPKADKAYILRDQVRHGEGAPLVVRMSGRRLLEEGLYILLSGGDAHVFEIEEIDASSPK